MAKIKGAIVVDTERCKGCNLCVVACPLDVIALNKEVNMKGYNLSLINISYIESYKAGLHIEEAAVRFK